MPALAASDAERLLRFVADAESNGGDRPFTGELLVELGQLIEADWVYYTEVDHVHRRPLVSLARPDDQDDMSADIEDDDWELMAEHPVCREWRRAGRFSALRLSDVVTQRELRQNRFYGQLLRPWGIEYELKARLPSPPWHAKTFMFERKLGRDFTRRDRLILDLLTPHLARVWHASRIRRLLSSALEALERAPEKGVHGVVLLGAGGNLEFTSAPARRLLRTFFPPTIGGRLPVGVVQWLETGAVEPLCRQHAAQVLSVVRSGDALLLSERRVEPDLTSREREVLSWVAQGKTNAEIAEALWLAPSTVRKHLENIYAKLGVSTRTAAVARFLNLIGVEAS